jgi:hypothetical protein
VEVRELLEERRLLVKSGTGRTARLVSASDGFGGVGEGLAGGSGSAASARPRRRQAARSGRPTAPSRRVSSCAQRPLPYCLLGAGVSMWRERVARVNTPSARSPSARMPSAVLPPPRDLP